jgi:hypothetical protein
MMNCRMKPVSTRCPMGSLMGDLTALGFVKKSASVHFFLKLLTLTETRNNTGNAVRY